MTDETDRNDGDDGTDWEKIDPPEKFAPFVVAMWEHARREELLAVEKRPGYAEWDHGEGYQAIVTFRDELENDYDDVREYLAKNTSKEEATKAANLYRLNHD